MKTRNFIILFLLLGALILSGKYANQHEPTLKSVFKETFLIGAAINYSQYMEDDLQAVDLIRKQFNSITAENCMKWESIHPEENYYNFEEADRFVEFGVKENMAVIGHTLVWHSQLPGWVVSTAEQQDSLQVLKRMNDHIKTVVNRYKGKVKGWDVVNEALEEDGTLRNSDYLKVLGPGYIHKAFLYAQQADPNAELYYNDYNIELPAKRRGALELIKDLKDRGVRIDAVGIQGHWGLHFPTLEDIETSIVEYSKLGVKVMITELDISVLKNPWDVQGADVAQNFEYSTEMDPYINALPPDVQESLAQRYKAIFEIFNKHKDKISRVTFWGVQDEQSWLNNWPIGGRTNYPLLFDRNYQPKTAYYSVLKTVNKN